MTIRYAALAVLIAAVSSCSGSTSELLAAKKQYSKTSSETAGQVNAKDIIGQLQDHQIASLSGRKITGQLSGALIDWRALADDTIHGDSIRSIKGEKITGRISADLVNWNNKKTYRINIVPESIKGQLTPKQLPDYIPFSRIDFGEDDKVPVAALPPLTADKLPPIPASQIDGVFAASQLPSLDQLSGTLNPAQLPDLADYKGKLPADRLTGKVPQEALQQLPASNVLYSASGKVRSWGSGKISNGGAFQDDENSGQDTNYYWYRVGKMVTLQFAFDSTGGDPSLKVQLPYGDIPIPTETMFSKCRKVGSSFFLDYAFGTASIWKEGGAGMGTATSQPLALTTTGSPNCPLPEDPGKRTFMLYAPDFPPNSRVSGVISYISDPRALADDAINHATDHE